MAYTYYVVNRLKTGCPRILAKDHPKSPWLDESNRHKAQSYETKAEAKRVLKRWLRCNSKDNRWNLYQVELYYVP